MALEFILCKRELTGNVARECEPVPAGATDFQAQQVVHVAVKSSLFLHFSLYSRLNAVISNSAKTIRWLRIRLTGSQIKRILDNIF